MSNFPQNDSFMQKFNESERSTRKAILKELEEPLLEIDVEYREKITELFDYAMQSRRLRKRKIGAKRSEKNNIYTLQTKNFNQIRNVWCLLRKHIESKKTLTNFDKLLETYLNTWCPRINKSKIKKKVLDTQPKGTQRYADKRAEKQDPLRDITPEERLEYQKKHAA